MAMEQQPPEVLAMLIADTALTDAVSGKHTIQGTFHTLTALEFPFRYPTLAVYVALTEGYGETPLQLRLIDVDEAREPISDTETVADFADPFAIVELVFVLSNLVFPEAGEYRLQLFGAGEPLVERRLYVSQDEP
jgi:hypothetical protein